MVLGAETWVLASSVSSLWETAKPDRTGGWGVVKGHRLGVKHWFKCASVKGRGENHRKYLIIVMFCSWRNWNIHLEGLVRGKFYLRRGLEARTPASVLVDRTLLLIYYGLS